MFNCKALMVAGVASLVLSAAAAHAADLPLPSPPVVEPPPLVVGGGWYLRGDVGAGTSVLTNSTSTFSPDFPYGTANGLPSRFAYNDASISEQVIVGGGVGYQFNSYFRGDVTGEYRFAGKYSAHVTAAGCNGPTGPCADSYGGHFNNGLVLANGYIDLGTWYGVTPYVGAGVGVAFNTFSSITDYNAGFFNTASGSSEAHTNTSFAYAFMGGFSFDLTHNLKFDVGYRYVNMGKVETGVINCYGGTSSCGNNSREIQHHELVSHDVRVGLRYQFADIIPAIPVIAKY